MAQSVTFMLTNSNVAVTGAVDGDFTKTLYRDGGATSETVTVSELGSGLYKATFTPVSVDKYHLFINHANDINYGPAGASFDWNVDTIEQVAALPSADNIADAVCDEVLSGHTTTGSLGKVLSDTQNNVSFIPVCNGFVDINIASASDAFLGIVSVSRPGGAYPTEDQCNLSGVLYVYRLRNNEFIIQIDGDNADYSSGMIGWSVDCSEFQPGDIYISELSGFSVTIDGVTSACPSVYSITSISREKNIEEHGIGAATYSLTVPVVDGDDNALAGAVIQLRDSSDNVLTQGMTRTADGKVIFLLEDGAYRLYPTKTGYSYAVEAGYVEVTVDGADTVASNITLTALATSAPDDPDKCNIYLNLKDAGSADTNATITLELSDRPNGIGSSDDQAILASSGTVTFTHQGSGEYLAEVYRNATYKLKGVDPKLTERNAVVTVGDWGQARIYFNSPNKEVIIKELS